MKVLMTGAAGYLGVGMWGAFEGAGHALRLLDVRGVETRHEMMVGDVRELEDCRRAVKGVEGMVIAHMAPRSPDAYATPVVSCDINVKGTANLLFAGVEAGVKKAVLISSTAATSGHKVGEDSIFPHTFGPKAVGIYGMTKALQEVVAEQYSREFGMSVSVIRTPWILDETVLVDKYGKAITKYNDRATDRRDIGEVCRLCLERDDIRYEVFNVMSTAESLEKYDVRHTCEFLGWRPAHGFAHLKSANQ